MNGVHDMGGLQGYGPVRIEANEPLFHGEWERRALGVTVAMGASGLWNIDLARSARESLPPLDYVQGPYYAIWTKALEKLLIEREERVTELEEMIKRKDDAMKQLKTRVSSALKGFENKGLTVI